MVVVCCISPSSKYIQETQSTLQFASRAKLVKTNANINKMVEGADAAAQLKVELGRSRVECNSLNEQLREQNAHNAVLKTKNYALQEENSSLKKQHAATMEELGRSRSEVHALEGQLRELKDQLRELKHSTAQHEHKSEITNIATSANDDDCQTFEKYASLADNSTTDFGYSDSKDDDISIRSDCSDHYESINFSEEEKKTMLIINVCDFGGYGIEQEKDDITITNSTGGTLAYTRCSGTSRNHSVIDFCHDDEEYIDNEIVEIENDNDDKIVPTTNPVYDREVKEIEDDGDKNEELEFLDLDETNGISTTTSRTTSIATIASLCGSLTSTNLGNCEDEEEEAKEDGNNGRDNSRVEEYEWSEEDGSSKTNNFIDKKFEFNKDDNSYGTCEEEEEDGNDGRDNSDVEEYEWDEEEDGSSETHKSLNKRTSIDATIYCSSRRCSAVIHEEQEVEDKEDNDSKDAEFEFDKDDDSTNGTSQSMEDNSDEEVECDEDDGSYGSSPIYPTKTRTRTCSATIEDSGLTKNAVIQQPSSSSHFSSNSGKQKRIPWNKQIKQLIEFKKEHGHCNVPQKYEADTSLGTWVSSQRKNYSGNRMKPERINQLNDLGFVWDVHEAVWLEYFTKLVQFNNEHGHCNVPARGDSLANWVMHQRQEYRKFQERKPCNGMNEERICKLEEIDFAWKIR